MMTAVDLIAFEEKVSRKIARGEVHTPTHLCGGNEEDLIEIFKRINTQEDWVFATYRNHYHALLFGIPEEEIMRQIVHGRSMTPCYPGRKFFTSAIVGGILPIAVGAAAGIARHRGPEHVWCFVGDMASTTGAFTEATRYAGGHGLPITFIIEDNGLACDTPTAEVWGAGYAEVIHYTYQRQNPHLGAIAA